LQISTEMIKELREQSGAGIMDCRNALMETQGDMVKAQEMLREKGMLAAAKKTERTTAQGLVHAYIHTGGRIGALIELNCESDFVARTDEFKLLAHHIAMQVAAMNPKFISTEQYPDGCDVEPQVACLLLQPDIKSPDRTVQDLITETIAKVGENIRVSRFARFELGELASKE
jgi:elongation factor Ts